MDEYLSKISAFLRDNPKSRVRLIANAIGLEKKIVNRHLYLNLDKMFFKEGDTPPLWSNIEVSEIDEVISEKVF